MTAVTSATGYSSSGRRELNIKDGYVQQEMKAPHGTPVVDGRLDEGIWKEAPWIFLGAYSPAHARIAAVWDERKLYLGYSVTDPSLSESPGRAAAQSDGIAVMFAAGPLKDDRPVQGSYKIYRAASGRTEILQGEDGSWTGHELPVESSETISDSEQRYQVEIAMLWSALEGRPDTSAGWGINFELLNYDPADNSLSREVISASNGQRP